MRPPDPDTRARSGGAPDLAPQIAADQSERIAPSVPLGTCARACSTAGCDYPACLLDVRGWRTDLTAVRAGATGLGSWEVVA